jgi:hypothetical protein
MGKGGGMRNIVTYNQLGRYGRFANQLYQIAGTIGIARKNGFDFAFPEWKNYDHVERFGSKEDIDLQKYFENPLPVYNGPQLPDRFVDWGYHDIKLKHSCSLSGHMQSLKYFEHCLDEVRWYFRMKDEEGTNGLCAIHYRAGDYDNAYHPVLPMSYYIEAIKQLPADQEYVLFSDDWNFSSKLKAALRERGIKYKDGQFVPSAGNYIDDFKLMKACRHFIIGNSTFSAMAAILGEAKDKRVIAPAPWFGPKYTDITGNDIYCPNWTVINYETNKVLSYA